MIVKYFYYNQYDIFTFLTLFRQHYKPNKKKMIKKTLLGIIISTTIFLGCKSDFNKLSTDNSLFVKEFPNTYSLNKGIKLNQGLFGVGTTSFIIQDSMIILSQRGNPNGLWSFISLPDYRNLGSFLEKGRGPNEFSCLQV